MGANLPRLSGSGSFAVGDYNNDGKPDILLTDVDPDSGQSETRIRLNQGDGSFTDANAGEGRFLILTNLTPGTTYYWSVQIIDGAYAGSLFAPEQTFVGPYRNTTAPTVSTLNAAISSDGLPTAVYFQYGTTTLYGFYSATNLLAPGATDITVGIPVAGLPFGATIHFRAVAVNGDGRTLGGDASFAAASAPVVVTLSAAGITYVIEAAGDPTAGVWTVTSTNTAGSDGFISVIDPQATNPSRRFYRLRNP